MKKIYSFTILAILLTAGAVSGQEVRCNFDKDTDFSKFKTYKWVDIKGAQKLDL